jgi:uncharacterized protein
MLEEQISEDYKQAMREKNPIRVSTLSYLRAQIKNVLIDKRVDKLDDPEVITIIKKQVKQREESIKQFGLGGRADLVEKEKAELEVLKGYLPQDLSEETLSGLIEECIKESGANSVKDMGSVMKLVMPRVAGRADNKLVSDLVRKKLSVL